MAKSMNVQFADGTSHTYDDVPDTVTQAEVNMRASTEYPGKEVAGVNEGANVNAPELTPTTPGPSPIEQGLGIAQTGLHYGMEAAPYLGGAAGLYKANKIANTYMAGKNLEAQTAAEVAKLRAEAAAGHQNIQQQKVNLRAGLPPTSEPMLVDAEGRPMASRPIAPESIGGATAAQTAQTAQTAQPMEGRFAQLAQRFAPAMQKIAPMLEGAGKVAGKALAPAMIAKELFYTSPEEVEQLKQMRQSGTSLKDVANQKMQQITNAMRLEAASKVIGP